MKHRRPNYKKLLFRLLNKSVLFVAASMFMHSCHDEKPQIPPEKMSRILLEMHVAEAYIKFIPKDSNKTALMNEDSLKVFIAGILKENKTNELEFKESMQWYAKQPEILDSVYQTILNDIAVLQASIN